MKNEQITMPAPVATVKKVSAPAPAANKEKDEKKRKADLEAAQAKAAEAQAKVDARFEAKAKQEAERVRELRKKYKPVNGNGVDGNVSSLCSTERTAEEAEEVTTKKQKNLCRKYGIRRGELQAEIEKARKIFVPKLATSCKAKVLVAIIELLELGDIAERTEKRK